MNLSHKCKNVIAALLLLSIIFTLVSCGESQGDPEHEKLVVCMALTKKVAEEYAPEAKFSNDAEDWVVVDDDAGHTVIGTNVTLDGEKQHLTYITTLSDDMKKGTRHFFMIGQEIYFDDGTVE